MRTTLETTRRLAALAALGVLGVLAASVSLTPLAAQDVNVAVLGFAEQSTTEFGGEASRAIDGNTSGVYGENSVSHTATGDPAPWWQVDLGDFYTIDRIVIWNRTDVCCPQRLTNFRVTILDDALDDVFDEDLFTDLTFPDPNVEIDVGGLDGQYVRIERLGLPEDFPMDFFLSLAEVEVFANAQNLAPIITQQPRGGRAELEGEFEFTVGVVGSEPLSYQWSKDGDDIEGATDSTLRLANLSFDDAGVYQVLVSNDAGDVTSDEVTLVVTQFNLARGAVAVQSTTGFGGEASRAVDGNTNGVYNNGSVSHTATGDVAPWWEVALFADATIDRIVLWNRLDCCSARLTNFRVAVLDAARDEVFSEDFFTDGFTFPDTSVDGFEIEADGVMGRFVRISRLGVPEDFPGQYFLSLAEVEVFGEGERPPEPPPNPNLAARPEAVTSQSSTLGAFGPRLAVNGNLQDFTHTAAGDVPATWSVDLGGENEITIIRLHNRTSCCGSRLRDITVTVLDALGDVVFESDLLNPENELGTFPNGPALLELDFDALVGGPVTGQTVRVVRTPDEDLSGTGGQGNADEGTVLSLAEVEVYPVIECPAEGDTHCTGLDVVGPDGGGFGVYQAMATATDDSGDLPSFTFRATNGVDTLTVGPQLGNLASFNLGVGTWTISVAVDDDTRFCEDVADDATCSTQVVIAGDPDNLALGKPATQSSTGFDGAPSRAVDGNTSGVYNQNSVTHTAADDPAPTWQVDLLEVAAIDRIVIWNRTDCCSERLTNFRVSVLDAGEDEVFSEDFFDDGFSFPDTTVDGFEIEADGVEGRFVRIERLGPADLFVGTFFLSLAEVQVYGETTGGGDPVFHRGDADNDGRTALNDGVFILNYLFRGGPTPTCLDSADTDDDGRVALNDGVFILNYLFRGGMAPPAPGPTTSPCGVDPTADAVDCASFSSCRP